MYSLSQLALFNRCLFPDDIYKDMLEVGASESDACIARDYLKRNTNVGVLGLYQEYISDDTFISYLEAVVEKFFKK